MHNFEYTGHSNNDEYNDIYLDDVSMYNDYNDMEVQMNNQIPPYQNILQSFMLFENLKKKDYKEIEITKIKIESEEENSQVELPETRNDTINSIIGIYLIIFN
jgi:hypothetical protein